MSEDKKETKNPIASAANKLQEEFTKGWQTKLGSKVKEYVEAANVTKTARKAVELAEEAQTVKKQELAELSKEYEAESAEFKAVIKDIA